MRKPGGLAVAEMAGQRDQIPSEMHGQGVAMPMPSPGLPPHRHEMAGTGAQPVYEMSLTGSHATVQYGQAQGGGPQAQAAYGPQTQSGGRYAAYHPQGYAPLPGQSYQAGPYEMPGQRWE
jgi:hypothetical protein